MSAATLDVIPPLLAEATRWNRRAMWALLAFGAVAALALWRLHSWYGFAATMVAWLPYHYCDRRSELPLRAAERAYVRVLDALAASEPTEARHAE